MKILTVALVLSFSSFSYAQEQKAVIVPPEVITSTRLDYQILNVKVQQKVFGYDWRFEIHYVDNLGNEFSYALYGANIEADPTAEPPILAENRAEFYVKLFNNRNFATRSLQCQALDVLKAKEQISVSALVCQ